MWETFWHHCEVVGHCIEKNKKCCTALSIHLHIIYYSLWFTEFFYSTLTLTTGTNNEG